MFLQIGNFPTAAGSQWRRSGTAVKMTAVALSQGDFFLALQLAAVALSQGDFFTAAKSCSGTESVYSDSVPVRCPQF